MDIAAQKAAIRAEMKAKREAIPYGVARGAGQAAVTALFHPNCLNLFQRYRCFSSYLSVGAEFPTEEIHYHLFQTGAALCVPRWSETFGHYHWAQLRPAEPMVQGPHNIPQPLSRGLFPAADVEVAIIPGLAFDIRGGRLGYGAGIYDRLLTKFRQGTLRIALAFDCQVQREPLPQEPTDIPVDYIVTESHWINCRLARNAKKK